MGLSTAYHLSLSHPQPSAITVIERDPSHTFNSACLSAGGVRTQFSLKENVEMSCYGVGFLKNTVGVENCQFHERGYLFLASSSSGMEALHENTAQQHAAGAATNRVLSPGEIRASYPWLNSDDLLGAGSGEGNEGWFDAAMYMAWLKAKAAAAGVKFVKGEVVSSSLSATKHQIEEVVLASGERISPGTVVNATGAFSGKVNDLLLVEDPAAPALPVKPRKRCVFYINCSDEAARPEWAPLTVDPTGVYFRSEGGGSGNYICGTSPPADWVHGDPDIDISSDEALRKELDNVDHDLFEEVIWPALYERVPAFGAIKVVSAWAGLYEYCTLDANAVIGYHPTCSNLLNVSGFSGHGLQQSPAAGRGVAELLSGGSWQTIDLDRFSWRRVLENEPLLERGIV